MEKKEENKKVWIIKAFPANEIYPDELIELGGIDPCEIRLYQYKGNLIDAAWAIANSMGYYANAFEDTEEKVKDIEKDLKAHMYDADFEDYLTSKGFV